MDSNRDNTSSSLHGFVSQRACSDVPLIINLQNLRYIDTSGIASMIMILRERLKRNARTLLMSLPDSVGHLFEIYHFPSSRIETISPDKLRL